MSIQSLVGLLPGPVGNKLRAYRRRRRAIRRSNLPPLSESRFAEILTADLNVRTGDVVYVHSGMDDLAASFPLGRVYGVLREVVGEKGTLLFPTETEGYSVEFLESGRIWDVRRTPSFTGILTEYARRQSGTHRSLHPTKSICAIGPLAEELTNTHHLSPYPYGQLSPHGKLIEHHGKVIGVGVDTRSLSFVHVVEDLLLKRFPVQTYADKLFSAKCLDSDGAVKIVDTYAHLNVTSLTRIPAYIKRHIPATVCSDLDIDGRPFFRADPEPLLGLMKEKALQRVTIYPGKVLK